MRLCFAALALVLFSCTLSNLTPQSRFSDAAYHVNDAARWGQLDLASQYVALEYKAQFMSRRAEWGERISVAEVDVVFMNIDREHDRATSEINLSWLVDGISLHKCVITQTWRSERGQFRLIEEKLKKGDPGLFAGATSQAP
jgi:hypothetical protein